MLAFHWASIVHFYPISTPMTSYCVHIVDVCVRFLCNACTLVFRHICWSFNQINQYVVIICTSHPTSISRIGVLLPWSHPGMWPLATTTGWDCTEIFGTMVTAKLTVFHYFCNSHRSVWELWKQHSTASYPASITHLHLYASYRDTGTLWALLFP